MTRLTTIIMNIHPDTIKAAMGLGLILIGLAEVIRYLIS